jgi:hypothetical protein
MLATIQFRINSFLHLLCEHIKIKIYKTIISPVILYRCETWSLTLKAEHIFRVSENRGLRRLFGPEREEAVGC